MPINRIEIIPFNILNTRGNPIYGEIRQIKGDRPRPAVVICHSFMAFKEWGFFPHIGERLAGNGFAAVTFNFSLNGVKANGDRITEFDKFASNTFSQEIEDVGSVVEALRSNIGSANAIDAGRIGLMGHSRGGGIAIVAASEDSRISALVTISAIATFDRWNDHQKLQWRKEGILPLAKHTSVSPLRLGSGLLEDLERNHNRLSITSAAARIGVPWLILHGREDLTVKSAEADELFKASGKPTTELNILEHVGHLYNAASENEDHYATLDGVLDLASKFLSKHLKKD